MVLPSRSEGLPRCIVEAMSRGCPCITSNVCGMPELINNRWLHEPEDYNRLATLIVEMAENKDLMFEAAQENYQNSHSFLRKNINERRNVFFLEFKNYCKKEEGKK